MPLPPAPSRKAARVNLSALESGVAPSPAGPAETIAADALSPSPTTQAARASQEKPARAARKTAKTAPAEAPVRPVKATANTETARPPANRQSGGAAPVKAKTTPRKGAKRSNGPTRLFVLDTNVLMHDPTSLFRFEEHDIYLPMIVLEELDSNKKGMSEVARNARQASRTLDSLAAAQKDDIARGLPLAALGNIESSGHLFFQTEPLHASLPSGLPQGKADNQILGVVAALRERHSGREVVLVSKDINMRIKARALGLAAEDYQNDKALGDDELLFSGALALPPDFWTRQSKTLESWQQGGHTFYRIGGPAAEQMVINQFVYFEAAGEPPLYARVTELRGKTAVLKTLKDYTHLKNAVWGVCSRNREQNFALNLLMDPEIDFVTLTGTAGTGKTLMALAAGLTQVLDERRYTEIIMTRATVSVGEDIGFLPGTEEEKMGPWMGALDDNLEFLAKGDGGNAGEWGRAATNELIRSRIKVKSMNFMRGRTFMNKYVIIDEAQNLTPKQMKTLITRAGPGTKIICMGNLAQIDTPYLTEGSSGLTYAVDRFKGWPHGGHITLARGERSRLADFASDVL